MNLFFRKLIFLNNFVFRLLLGIDAGRLSISGSHFMLDGERVFLSGTNQAWVSYAYDFGNGQYSQRKGEYERVLDELQSAGGNSVRKYNVSYSIPQPVT